MKKGAGPVFIVLALVSLLSGLFFGCIGAFQFIFPGFLENLPFYKIRPLHVSLVVSWIFMSAIGGIYYYLPNFCGIRLFSERMPRFHLWLFILTGGAILASYFAGKFGGREYWEFPAVLAIPIFISWIAFGINFFKSVRAVKGRLPVYIWMWGTGILFFFITFSEAYLWIFPYFRDNLVRDLTTQWKAYGALVGSWNMLVYGTAIFLMCKMKNDDSPAHAKPAFLMYFLGLFNLMFGWAHHIYIVPSAPWIRYISYLVSMSELIVLAKIILDWKKSASPGISELHPLPYRFILASDAWIFINLCLAILISVPAINIYTHGTHITVAHAMGSTIGINTMILLSSCFFLLGHARTLNFLPREKRVMKAGFWITNISLLIFWLALVSAGLVKGRLIIENKLTFREIMQTISPALLVFACAGLGLLTGMIMVCAPVLKKAIRANAG